MMLFSGWLIPKELQKNTPVILTVTQVGKSVNRINYCLSVRSLLTMTGAHCVSGKKNMSKAQEENNNKKDSQEIIFK
jgi:hypothetical protein